MSVGSAAGLKFTDICDNVTFAQHEDLEHCCLRISHDAPHIIRICVGILAESKDKIGLQSPSPAKKKRYFYNQVYGLPKLLLHVLKDPR